MTFSGAIASSWSLHHHSCCHPDYICRSLLNHNYIGSDLVDLLG
ncbi:MAG TPA: hypothetical protein VK203_31485 [Nostocaceae cyanobacterium]|nr:hypothetical protein [Nostocaceae cyanobacterium]